MKSKGLSLLEMLTALVLSSIVLIEVYKIYQINLQTHQTQKVMAEIQRNARFALDTLTKTVRSTGFAVFFGSLSRNVESLLAIKDDIRWDTRYAVVGYDNVQSSDVIAGVTGFTAASDVIVIKQTIDPLPVLNNDNDYSVTIDGQATYQEGDLLLLTNLNNASVFQASTITLKDGNKVINITSSGTPGNDSGLSVDYSLSSDISRLQSVAYFIKPNASENNHDRPVLYRALFNNQKVNSQVEIEEIASNIIDFQLAYGIDSDNSGKVSEYKTADQVTDWGQVVSIGISVVVASDQPLQGAQKTQFTYHTDTLRHSVFSSTMSKADRRMKKQFSTFVDLKNRLM